MTGETGPVRIRPVVGWPARAQQGHTYLITVDVRLEAGESWPYPAEEYEVGCHFSVGPSCAVTMLGQPGVVLHRFGATYGPAEFLLTAHEDTDEVGLALTLVNQWGIPIRRIPLPMRVAAPEEGDDAEPARTVERPVPGGARTPSSEPAASAVPGVPMGRAIDGGDADLRDPDLLLPDPADDPEPAEAQPPPPPVVDRELRVLRVIVVSPGDVQRERAGLATVIDELNREIAAARGYQLALWRWETDARPGVHVAGPQGVIDEQMQIKEADIVIGIFWRRFGTPTQAAGSATEHELRLAWDSWLERERPEVMLYFCQRPFTPASRDEAQQWARVLEFQQQLPESQLWWSYMDPADFERVVREHLTRRLLDFDARGDAAPVPPPLRRLRFNLPLVPAGFTGREAELAAINDALEVSDRAVISQVITGLGGVGKSVLAARYVGQRADAYDVVAWIRAEDGGVADLGALADRLGLDVEGLTPQERAARALYWLERADERWLLVLDNLASADQLRDACPRSGNGRVIVTSRDRALAQFGPLVSLDVFDEATATEYLVRRVDRPDDRDGARRLASALGYLPLALSHAGAYCALGTSFEGYLALLEELPPSDLLASSPEAFYSTAIDATWRVSIRAATTDAPLAAEVLAMAAYLAPDAIPRDLFGVLVGVDTATAQRVVRQADGHLRPIPRPAAADVPRLSDAFDALARYSLITIDDTTIGMHRLLQKIVRDAPLVSRDRSAFTFALIAVDEAMPDDPSLPASWPRCEQLLAHVFALADAREAALEGRERMVGLVDRATGYLFAVGGGPRAVQAAGLAVAVAERILGPEHPASTSARASLAIAYAGVGQLGEAIELGQRVVVERERVLGPRHRATLSARTNLSVSYQGAGRLGEAAALQEQVLRDSEAVLGPDDPDTLRARANLAGSLRELGRYDESIELGSAVLADFERVLGPEHPSTLRWRAELASAYLATGRSELAGQMSERVVADSERILGFEHPDTATARANLAAAYESLGRPGDAIGLAEHVLADRARFFGAAHPDTVRARETLARLYRASGRDADANALEAA